MDKRTTLGRPPSLRGPKLILPPEALRDRIAEAAHRAVCEFTESDGFRHCYQYMLAGQMLSIMTGVSPKLQPQAGTLRIEADPSQRNCWFAFEAVEDGIERGEFHTWLASKEGIIVDLSARHYRRYVEEAGMPEDPAGRPADGFKAIEGRLPWRRGEPPAYVWSRFDNSPPWIMFHANQQAMDVMHDRMRADAAEIKELMHLCKKHLDGLPG